MFAIYPGFTDVAALRPVMSALVGVFGIPALLVCMLFSQASKIALAQSNVPGVSPLLPTVSSSEGLGFFFPGTGIFIPFWQALIAMICLLVPHELAHGILTRAHKIRLKSAGVLTASVIPIGAFVEPDERILRLRRSREKMRIYAVGSFMNLIVAILSIFLIVSVIAPMTDAITEPTGIMITSVLNNTPAYGVLQQGFVITKVNGVQTNDTTSFNEVVHGLKPNQTVAFVTTNGTFNITLTPRPDNASRGYIGIDLQQTFSIKQEFMTKYMLQTEAIFFLAPTLFWIFFLSFNIALVNLLPISPFDGGKMFEEIMADFRVRRKNKELLLKIMLAIIIVLLLMNASPLLLNLFR
jgi:membrane-associated protease RseP (regulator of RpoE activity)